MFITIYRHNKIMKQYTEHITDLKKALYRKEKLEEVCDKLADKMSFINPSLGSACMRGGVMDQLDDTIPRYVDDYFGGKVIKQESNPVTILDRTGKATYGVTGKALPKGHKYHLIQDKN